LLRLLRHGDRPRSHARLRVSGELRLSVRLDLDHGVLAALAHLALRLVPRLPLRPARREPAQPGTHVPEPGDRLLPLRPLARGEVELRRLGYAPRRLPRDGAGRARTAPRARASGPPARLPAAR